MKLKDVLEKTAGFFREKGSPSPRLDAEILLAFGLNIERIRLYIDFDRPLTEDELAGLRELVRRRAQGEPVAYITGHKDFFGAVFEVTPDVLIPRPETEQIVEEGLEWLKKNAIAEARVVDLGCGSGCVGLSVLKNDPTARLLAVDISAGALSVARRNAERLGVQDRAVFLEADASKKESAAAALSEAGFEKIDLLLANPPYIDPKDPRVEDGVKRFEPEAALFAGDQGLAALKTWSRIWSPFLASPGLCLMEMGLDQGPSMKDIYSGLFTEAAVLKDLAGHDRVIKGVRHG
ncbi:MAG: peptide chain release factor N(5)-glutamine methyltransferase [Bdellovibrionaceae bacterium]|nr:peptide chain release factor N(5)-glutamine methyltransferase [Pseudobdellovibrionaceae bacterium]MBX3033712.1 peptide chain release factor N(5)-glutamine methyltransferase [Pseudobdellovibrionaceae bacterium]